MATPPNPLFHRGQARSSQPGLRTAPEYAGTAGARTEKPADPAAADAGADQWQVFGVSIVAQLAAENAAAADGMSLGEWITDLVEAQDVAPQPAAPPAKAQPVDE